MKRTFILFALLTAWLQVVPSMADDASSLDEVTPPPTLEESADGIETFRERFPDGKLRVERQVKQDDSFNYINHGSFRQWDIHGNLRIEGQYDAGKATGTWARWHTAEENRVLKVEPFSRFTGPFLSEATFVNGELSGAWTIKDRQGRAAFEAQFVAGLREGQLIWFFPNGSQQRVVEYRGGLVDGTDKEFNEQGEELRSTVYFQGRRRSLEKTTFVSTARKSEASYLHPQLALETPDDWWTMTFAGYRAKEGSPVQHGKSIGWHESGQMRFYGQYEFGKPVGDFNWWLENGQRSIKGSYDDQGRQNGTWYWWHENGFKSIEGHYVDGKAVGRWMWWNTNGQLANAKDLTAPVEEQELVSLVEDAVDPPPQTEEAEATQQPETTQEPVVEDFVIEQLPVEETPVETVPETRIPVPQFPN